MGTPAEEDEEEATARGGNNSTAVTERASASASASASAVSSDSTSAPSGSPLIDVTDILSRAASSVLDVADPMLSTAGFNLQDSMSALEIRNPKLDCCEIPVSHYRLGSTDAGDVDKLVAPRPAPSSLDHPDLPWDDLTLRQSAHIALELLVRLESLLSGASCIESTFTCLYAHRPIVLHMRERIRAHKNGYKNKNCQDPDGSEDVGVNVNGPSLSALAAQSVVYAATMMLLELTDVFRSVVLNADIYEEEDFSVSTYGIDTASVGEGCDNHENEDRNGDNDGGAAINAVLHALDRMSSLEGDEEQSKTISMISSVLGAQMGLMIAITSLARLVGKDVVKETIMAQTVLQRDVKVKLESVLEFAREWNDERKSQEMRLLILSTFDAYVNRTLVGNAPIRQLVSREVEESIGILINIVNDMNWAFCDLIVKGTSLARIQRMLCRVSVASPNILVRSLIVLNLYFDDKLLGRSKLVDMVATHIKHSTGAPDTIFENPYTVAFLSRLAKPVYDKLKVHVLNRNRQRAYIDLVMIPEWSSLQQEAQVVDMTYCQIYNLSEKSPPYFFSYSILLTLELMVQYLSLGIDLKLFCSHHDISVAYWYQNFLLSALVSQQATARQTKADRKLLEAAANAAGSKNRKRKGSKQFSGNNHTNRHKVPAPTGRDEKQEEDEFEFLYLNAKRSLFRGLSFFLAAINQAGMVETKLFAYTSFEKIFQKRFEPFAGITQPPPLSYSDFLQGSDSSNVSPEALWQSASQSFEKAKDTFEMLLSLLPTVDDASYLSTSADELKCLSKVCLGNTIYMQKLRQTLTKRPIGELQSSLNYTLDFGAHALFCTIKLG